MYMYMYMYIYIYSRFWASPHTVPHLTPCACNSRHGARGIRRADGGVEGPSMEHGAAIIAGLDGFAVDFNGRPKIEAV